MYAILGNLASAPVFQTGIPGDTWPQNQGFFYTQAFGTDVTGRNPAFGDQEGRLNGEAMNNTGNGFGNFNRNP